LSAPVNPLNRKAPWRDRIIPWYFVLGFMVVLAVNIFFVRTALRSNPGVVTEHAYEKGLAYNAVLDKVKTEHAAGWQGKIAYRDGQLQLTLHDKNNRPIDGASVTMYIDRPLQEGFGNSVMLSRVGKARYAAPVTFPMPGQWDITASIVWKKHYLQIRQRILAH